MVFKQGTRALLFSIAILASFHVPAAVLDNLYQVQMTQQEDQSRDDAMRAATVVMLQRLAGNDVNLQHEAIAGALETPQQLMARIGSGEAKQLRIQFEPDALSRVLKQADQPLLGPNRPGILLWAIEAEELGDRLLSPVAPRALLLKQAAQHRGVALSFPLGDLEDMSQVDEKLIRQAAREPLLEASKRYPAEGTLALVVGGTDERTELNWTLWLNDQHKSGRRVGSTEQVADELMEELAGLVFAQYAIPAAPAGEHTEWRLQVEGVDGVGAYSGLLGMLRRIGTQQQPKLLEIDGDRVMLQVSFPGNEAQLERMLGLDMRLQRIPEPVVEPEAQPVLPSPEVDDQLNALDERAEPGEQPGLEASSSLDPNAPADSIADEAGTTPELAPMPELQDDTRMPAELSEPVEATEATEVLEPAEPELPTLYFRWRG